ncbi:MAG: guanylate kinase [Ignavibacteria bacterium]|nr:MAG: guanylate kinase [Ignavibacteria bacterium]
MFSAPSGAGKTTIIKYILKEFPQLVFSVSATTRAKRENEIDGKDYFFISEDEFKQKIENNEFVEWESFYGYYYGTLKSFIDETVQSGNTIVLELDVKGALNIKNQYPNAVLIFIEPPSKEALAERLKRRNTESEADFKKRIERASMELQYKDRFDYSVVNADLEVAKEEVKKIVENEINKEVIK